MLETDFWRTNLDIYVQEGKRAIKTKKSHSDTGKRGWVGHVGNEHQALNSSTKL